MKFLVIKEEKFLSKESVNKRFISSCKEYYEQLKLPKEKIIHNISKDLNLNVKTVKSNYNLKKLNHKHNLTCIVLEGVSEKVKNILKKSDMRLHEYNLKNLLKQFNMSDDYCNYLVNKHYYGKYLIFNLMEYDKIIYLDTDLLIRENIDHLFEFDTENVIYMTYDIGENNNNLFFRDYEFNSGVIILKPSIITYNKCYNELSTFENNINEISTTFSLKGESAFWLILRTDKDFDEYSVIIRISKDDKSQSVHMCMGTYVRDVHNNLVFKIFSKQQLIDFSSKIKIIFY
jgi:hypothetical protein